MVITLIPEGLSDIRLCSPIEVSKTVKDQRKTEHWGQRNAVPRKTMLEIWIQENSTDLEAEQKNGSPGAVE